MHESPDRLCLRPLKGSTQRNCLHIFAPKGNCSLSKLNELFSQFLSIRCDRCWICVHHIFSSCGLWRVNSRKLQIWKEYDTERQKSLIPDCAKPLPREVTLSTYLNLTELSFLSLLRSFWALYHTGAMWKSEEIVYSIKQCFMKSNTYRHYNNYNDYYVFIVIKQKFLKDKFLVEDIGINETVLENL